MNRRTRLARITPLRSYAGLARSPWSRSVPLAGTGLARNTASREAFSPEAGTGKSAAKGKRVSLTARPCMMCREPAQSGSRYCAPCTVVRELVLERDSYACVCCGTCIIGRHYSLGHRLRASHGGRAVPSNLVVLLGLGGELCHGRIDGRLNPHDEARGFTVRSWDDPAQIPVMVFSEHGSGATVWLWDDGEYHAEGPQAGGA